DSVRRKRTSHFDAQLFLDSAGLARRIEAYRSGVVIFLEGELGDSVLYIQTGSVNLSITNATGKEAVVAVLGPGDFLGEGCLAGQPMRMGTATAITPASLLVIDKNEMI